MNYPEGHLTGVYAITHSVCGIVYIGGSKRCIGNRLSVHMCFLRAGTHPSTKLQKLWKINPDLFGWTILELCTPDTVQAVEKRWSEMYPHTAEAHPARGYSHTEETRRKQQEGRARYLETPGAVESLSERAKKQWSEGNLGRKSALTDDDVAEMRLIRGKGHTLRQIARAFDVSAAHVSRVLRDR